MKTSDALWEVFRFTGHVGAYLLYKTYSEQEQEVCTMLYEPDETVEAATNSVL